MLRLLGALLLLAALAGGVLYFQSDVFRTRFNTTVDEWTKWTPENITKDPKGYLTFAITELDKIGERLKTHKRELLVKIDAAENRITKETLAQKASTTVLDSLKDAYRAGKQSFPVSYASRDYKENQFQDLVVETDRLLEMARENATSWESHLGFLKEQLERTEKEMKRLTEKRQFVEQRLQLVELNTAVNSANDLTSKADEIASVAKNLTPEANNIAAREAKLMVKAAEQKLEGQSVKDRFEQIMGSK